MDIREFYQDAIKDRLESWELIEFLQIPIETILDAAIEFDWINEENLEDLLEFTGIKHGRIRP